MIHSNIIRVLLYKISIQSKSSEMFIYIFFLYTTYIHIHTHKMHIMHIIFFLRANSLKRALRRLVEHKDSIVDEKNLSDEKQDIKTSNITIISDDIPINDATSKFFVL